MVSTSVAKVYSVGSRLRFDESVEKWKNNGLLVDSSNDTATVRYKIYRLYGGWDSSLVEETTETYVYRRDVNGDARIVSIDGIPVVEEMP